MLELTVITDVPESLTLAEGKAVSYVQIAKVGSYKDPRYGNFSITRREFDTWIKNFDALHKANGRLGLPIDVDHRPETQGNTEAAGWLTELTIKAGGTELWAKAEWNDLGQELVGNRRYAYISPSYVPNYKDETGKEHGTALLGVALTNRPFLSMATVSLSKHVQTSTETYTPSEMTFPKTLLDALGLAADADEAVVLAKIAELTTKPEPQNKSLAEQASAQGMIVMSTTQHQVLEAKANQGAEAAKQLTQMRFDNAFDKALNDPKGARVAPAQRESLLSFYTADADGCIKFMEEAPNLVNAQPIGRGGGGDETTQLSTDHNAEDFVVDDDMVKLDNKAQSLMQADSNLTYGDAVSLAMSQLGME